jgi:hypothetical protein
VLSQNLTSCGRAGKAGHVAVERFGRVARITAYRVVSLAKYGVYVAIEEHNLVMVPNVASFGVTGEAPKDFPACQYQ